MNEKEKLIVALDVPNFEEAKELVESLGDTVEIYKIGYQLFVAYGPFIVRYLAAQGKKVFLDLKFHDIPNTVANAVRSAISLGVAPHEALLETGEKSGRFEPLLMLTVHTCGGKEMMECASEAAQKMASELKIKKPFIVGVTVLTSDAADSNMSAIVLERARLAQASGLDGVVASAQEARMLREEMGQDFIIVTPGIRPCNAESQDQKRVATPSQAIQDGSSFLVIGRPIVKSTSPKQAAEDILKEMA